MFIGVPPGRRKKIHHRDAEDTEKEEGNADLPSPAEAGFAKAGERR